MKSKGFTLIELIVTIVIMSLILLLVMPAIIAVVNKNEEKKYDYYAKGLVEAAKIYVDKEGEDINPIGSKEWKGCIDITYEDLLKADLIKPYDDPNVDCSIGTKVRYTKEKSKSKYTYNMTCKENGKIVYEHKGIENNECTVIDLEDHTPPVCGAVHGASTEWIKEGKRKITVECSDESGECESVTKTFKDTMKVGYIEIWDNNGNKNKCPVNVYIDKEAPSCTSSGGSDNWSKSAVTIKGTCADSDSGCAGDASKTYSNEGSYTKQSPGVVKDKAGNETTCPADQTIKIDKTAPTFTITSVFLNGVIRGDGKKYYFGVNPTYNDNLSGLRNAIDFNYCYEWPSDTCSRIGLNPYKNSATVPNYNQNYGANSNTWMLINWEYTLTRGRIYNWIKVYDNAGNYRAARIGCSWNDSNKTKSCSVQAQITG